jgi:hypothetical protein
MLSFRVPREHAHGSCLEHGLCKAGPQVGAAWSHNEGRARQTPCLPTLLCKKLACIHYHFYMADMVLPLLAAPGVPVPGGVRRGAGQRALHIPLLPDVGAR